MMIKTTMNLHEEVYERLARASMMTGRSRRDIVSALMSHVMRTGRCKAVVRGGVRYQQRNGKAQWRCLHIGLEQDEYEFFFDLKKVMKMSVSFVTSWAIECFLDEFLKSVIVDGDNYRYKNYAMYNVTIGNVFHIILCWGIPPRLITD
jgi:hypothetical protein